MEFKIGERKNGCLGLVLSVCLMVDAVVAKVVFGFGLSCSYIVI